jgi:hypothetical protein
MAFGEVAGRPIVGKLDHPPRLVGVEKDEQVHRTVAPISIIVALDLSGFGFADKLRRAFVEAHNGALVVGRFGVENVFHPGDIAGIDVGNTPHVLALRLEVIVRQAPLHHLA